MKIEVIENKSFVEIWVAGSLWQEMHQKFYKNEKSALLRSPSQEELQQLLKQLNLKYSRILVYRWLAQRGYMKSELESKLARYKIPLETIQITLEECEQLGYVDDQRERKLLIAREKRKGSGPQIIAYKLRQKAPEMGGIGDGEMSAREQVEAIQQWIQKKSKGNDLDAPKVKGKLYRFLKRKGFDDHLIHQELFTS